MRIICIALAAACATATTSEVNAQTAHTLTSSTGSCDATTSNTVVLRVGETTNVTVSQAPRSAAQSSTSSGKQDSTASQPSIVNANIPGSNIAAFVNPQSGTTSTSFQIKGLGPGRTTIIATDPQSRDVCAIRLTVLPQANRFAVTTGIGTSSIALQNFSSQLVTPAPAVTPPATPAPGPSPGVYVFASEKSQGQTFIPVLASYRITDSPSAFNVFATGGLSASGNTSGQLYGVSYGREDFLFTIGWHSATVQTLAPNLGVGFNSLTTFIPGQSLTVSSRTTRPFVSLTFSLTCVGNLFSSGSSAASTGCTGTSNPAGTSSTASTGGK